MCAENVHILGHFFIDSQTLTGLLEGSYHTHTASHVFFHSRLCIHLLVLSVYAYDLIHADDNTDHKKQMRAMEQELLQSLSIDTAAPTFEAIELLDENGNTPSANLKAVLTAMKKSHENLNALSVNVPPSPITPSKDEPVDVKMDVSSSETWSKIAPRALRGHPRAPCKLSFGFLRPP